MALTLVEAAKLSNDVLLQGVIETTVLNSPILQRLPFIEIAGNGLSYNRENAMATADFYDVGDTWNESTPTFTLATAALKIMGGDADVDNFLKSTRSNIQDLEAAIIELKAKAVQHKFENTFIYGNATTSPKQFNGLANLIDTATASDQVVAAGATGATLTLTMLDELCDAVRGGKPDLLLMSRRSRRKIANLVRAANATIGMIPGPLGNLVEAWGGIPMGISDWILDTHTLVGSVETAYTGDVCSTIYAMQFGEGALAGLTSPGNMQVERIGSLETKDASRTRIKWYCSLALFSAVKAAALIGVTD